MRGACDESEWAILSSPSFIPLFSRLHAFLFSVFAPVFERERESFPRTCFSLPASLSDQTLTLFARFSPSSLSLERESGGWEVSDALPQEVRCPCSWCLGGCGVAGNCGMCLCILTHRQPHLHSRQSCPAASSDRLTRAHQHDCRSPVVRRHRCILPRLRA